MRRQVQAGKHGAVLKVQAWGKHLFFHLTLLAVILLMQSLSFLLPAWVSTAQRNVYIPSPSKLRCPDQSVPLLMSFKASSYHT